MEIEIDYRNNFLYILNQPKESNYFELAKDISSYIKLFDEYVLLSFSKRAENMVSDDQRSLLVEIVDNHNNYVKVFNDLLDIVR